MEFGQGADQLLTVKTGPVTKPVGVHRAWADLLVRPKQWKRNMKIGTWNIRSLCWTGSLTAAAAGAAAAARDWQDIN